MAFPSDLEIAKGAKLKPLGEVAESMGLRGEWLEPYGKHVAKISLDAIEGLKDRPKAKYVVVSAITPTPLGEGKTTTTVGLGQAFSHIGKKATIAIRQPSMGPTFGIKGGAAGGGYSQVVPMEILNLHLTGDMHAITAAHNLLAAMIDNHIYQNDDFFHTDRHSVTWRRVLDVNDRSLRDIITGLGSREDGVPRETGFDITPASEVMAILALSRSLKDMRERIGRIVIGYSTKGEPITAESLKAAGAMTVIMKDAIKPNLMQTLENTPVLVHAGPFGNIAHGNSSIVADLIGIHSGDFLVTEAGFGADMGAERFFNIKCRNSGLKPDAAVLVTTVRALKAHSGKFKITPGKPLPESLLKENADDVLAGADNLRKQIENIRLHGVSPVVAINAFPGDFESEYAAIREVAESMGARVAVAKHFAQGGRGAAELAEVVAEAANDKSNNFNCLYPDDMSLADKIETVAKKVYGASDVKYDLRGQTAAQNL
ncbi:MAG: formate--tetrahydrofolate ligase [Deinococcales bacterium]